MDLCLVVRVCVCVCVCVCSECRFPLLAYPSFSPRDVFMYVCMFVCMYVCVYV